MPFIADQISSLIERTPELWDTDLVYANWLWTGGAVGLALRRRFGWPVAAIARGSEMHNWRAIHPHCLQWVRTVLAESDLPLANCEAFRNEAIRLVPSCAGRVRVAYNGCDTRVFRPGGDRRHARRALGLDPRMRTVLCSARIVAHKGLAELAEAWGRFSSRHPDWQLVCVGTKSDASIARGLRRAGPRVRVVGPVAPARVAEYLRAADLYVQPSHAEGLSNATLEAMATGLPVISSDVFGQRELIDHDVDGILVPPGDVPALQSAMHRIAADDGVAAALGRAARQRAVGAFDSASHSERLAGLLERLYRGARSQDAARH